MTVIILDGGPEDGRETVTNTDPGPVVVVPIRHWPAPGDGPDVWSGLPIGIGYYNLRGTDHLGRVHYLWQGTALGPPCNLCGHWAIDHLLGPVITHCHRCPGGICKIALDRPTETTT